MSRIGKKPIELPSGVSLAVADREVTVKGPKGEMRLTARPEVDIEVEGSTVRVLNNHPRLSSARAYHGLTRALIGNMVTGVSTGFERKLEINGVGYNAALEGSKIVLNIGLAHSVSLEVPSTVQLEVPNQTTIIIRGCDKQQVGEMAARIRKLRPPEPYKGKGIKYDFEVVRRKAGKAFGSA